jgi:hypothetical protein
MEHASARECHHTESAFHPRERPGLEGLGRSARATQPSTRRLGEILHQDRSLTGNMTDNSVVSATSPEPPIFRVDGRDVSSYESLEAAGADVESYDVAEGAWYDRKGRLLQATSPYGRRAEPVVVLPHDPPEFRPDVLAEALRQHLQWIAANQPAIAHPIGLTADWAETAPLADLVDMSIAFKAAWSGRPSLALRLWRRLKGQAAR